MSDKKISELNSATALTGSEILPIVQDDETKKVTAQEIADLAAGGGAVDSVNGQTGVVVLDASDVGAATAAQGTLADTAVQPDDLAEVATTGDYDDLLNKPALASVATSGSYNDLSDLPSSSSAGYARVFYVDQHAGNDTTGDGSLTAPFQTISKAMSEVPDSGLSLTNAYCIQLGSGQYTEASLAIKPYVHICGRGYLATRINVSTNQITLDNSANGFHSNARIGFYNLSLAGSTGFNFDLSAMPNASCVLDGRGCWVNGACSFKGRAYGADYIELYEYFFFSNVTAENIQGEIVNSTIAGATNIICNAYSSAGNTDFSLGYNRMVGTLTVTSDDSRNQRVGLDSVDLNAIVANGANITVSADVISIPTNPASITLTGGAVLTKTTKLHCVDNLEEQLDLRARRVSVPASASDTGQVGDYAVDATYAYFCIATDTWVRTPVATW